MIVIRDLEDARRIADPSIHALLTLRLQQLGPIEDGLLVVVEAGDCVEELEAVSGVAVLHDTFEDVPYGHPDFTPSFDFVIDHHAAYEMHFDSSDDGIGTTLLIPKGNRIDADLLALCAQYAVPIPD
jgi:hypothetical protein